MVDQWSVNQQYKQVRYETCTESETAAADELMLVLLSDNQVVINNQIHSFPYFINEIWWLINYLRSDSLFSNLHQHCHTLVIKHQILIIYTMKKNQQSLTFINYFKNWRTACSVIKCSQKIIKIIFTKVYFREAKNAAASSFIGRLHDLATHPA